MAMSFGEEGVDRYIVVYKREHPPTDDEVAARRDGLEWSEAKALEYKLNVSDSIVKCRVCYTQFTMVFIA